MDPNESRMVIGRDSDELTKYVGQMNLKYAQSLNHVLRRGPYAGQVAATVLLSDEGLVELDRMAGDESADELDRIAAEILTHHPHSRVRLDRLRAAANLAMDTRAAETAAVH